MKKVLITGANSYIGTSFENWIKENNADMTTDTLDMIGDGWREFDFSGYDAVVHVAGIVHQKKNAVPECVYYQINRDLVVEVASRAKKSGVEQFVFLSTMSVYGMLIGCIGENTYEMPFNAYGKSKLEAEKELLQMQSCDFVISIIRPPMIYGKGCKGNYVRLRQLALACPVFPLISNQRSMVYIDNLCAFTEGIILSGKKGIFYPQDSEYVDTFKMVSAIRRMHGKKLLGIKWFNSIIRLLKKRKSIFQKVWGDLCYDMSLSKVEGVNYQIKTMEQAIEEIES